VRHALLVQVPTRLEIERTTDRLSITVDRNSFEPAQVMVGTGMLTGVQRELFVYRAGEQRTAFSSGLGGIDFNVGTDSVNRKLNGIPVPGETYVVGMDLAIFETDIPPQHLWSPYSKNFRILWRRTLHQTVE
jgi:hypothetical protein